MGGWVVGVELLFILDVEFRVEVLCGLKFGIWFNFDFFLVGFLVVLCIFCVNWFVGLLYWVGVFVGVVMDGCGLGVICCWCIGEFGCGREVCGGCLFWGLGVLVLGLIEVLNSFGNLGVGGVKLVEFWLLFFSLFWVVGVWGIEL